MKTLKFAVLFCSAVHVLSAQAQEDKVEEAPKRVEVSSYKGPELRSYSQMLKGLMAYQEKQSHAPNSELYFILIPKSKKVGVQGLTMRLASDETSINIPIDAEGKFQLPLIALKHDDEYDLILNKPKGQFYIKPYVKSANLPEDSKRLGDIRLECQVRWAIERQDVSVVFSSYVKLFGSGNPCTSRAVSVYFFAPNDVKLVTLETAKSKFSFDVNANGQYPLPVWNTELSDEGVLKYERSLGSVAKQEN
jgi:hypothetical protein